MGSLKPRDAVLLDTNILIDFLGGHREAQGLLASLNGAVISIVSWIEVLAGARSSEEEGMLKAFLDAWPIIPLDVDIAQRAAGIRREQRIKLPDAIVLATAQREHRKLVTRNTKDFDANDLHIIVPYQISKPSRDKESKP